MNVYGYLLNLHYAPGEHELLWNFQKKMEDGSISNFIGIEAISAETCSDYVIIGNSEVFNAWLNEFGTISPDIPE